MPKLKSEVGMAVLKSKTNKSSGNNQHIRGTLASLARVYYDNDTNKICDLL